MMRCPMPACGSEEWYRIPLWQRDDEGRWTEVKADPGSEFVRCARCTAAFIVIPVEGGSVELVQQKPGG
jgi:hypothetical protein